MALKLTVETFGKRDALAFRPADLIPRFAAYTGRYQRPATAVEAMGRSLLLHGQQQPFAYRKDDDDQPIPMTGHTRILGADWITRNRMVGPKGIQYGDENPFLVYGIYRKIEEDVDAVILGWVENDGDTRTPVGDLDAAFLIRTLSESYGLKDAEIAQRLGKDPSWVSRHRTLLELDPATQAKVADGTLGMAAALTMATVEPAARAEVIEKAKKTKTGKVAAAAIAEAVRDAGAKTSKVLGHTDAEFKAWLTERERDTPAGPGLAFIFGIKDFRAGKIGADELTGLFEHMLDVAEVVER